MGAVCPPPAIHYGLSMVRTNYNGVVKWFFQPLPFNLDQDPDWNAGATIMNTDCGKFIVSVMKDGWTYAVDAADGHCFWQFPDMGNPGCKFPRTDGHYHGSEGFRVPGGVWGNVLVIATGGYALPANGSTAPNVIRRLHAIDACATSGSRGTRPHVRWLISPVPHTSDTLGQGQGEDAVGAPTLINGLVYVGTNLGHVMVFADPSVVQAAGVVCDNTAIVDPGICIQSGGELVPVPSQVVDVALCDQGCDAARLRKEIVLAEGLALASTSGGVSGGHVYALGPTAP